MKKEKPHFTRTSGAPFSEEDAQIIGAELLKIAEANKIGDVRLLNKELVFAAIEADPDHPLRRFYDWDVKRAARKHWLAWTQKLMASVRIEVKIGKFTRPLPITVSAELPRLSRGTKRQRVLTLDAMLDDPVFASAIGLRLRNLDTQLAQVEMLVDARGGPHPSLKRLLEGLRGAFAEYYSEIKVAAE